ncbi:DUF2271 domain-containing protein [Sphingobium sp. CCH11-B1]|jgi:hypothetical protein|uniref:DUF2271 domain-containing protein n=1 Tax=Sphingobium sp. CCH11-B1 TaxID=1768781 RepID=UPI00082AB539|nr:DUF2271 domain-containing protein [Sphingobium sp. CCH11-B1]MEA3387922.1 DUF2271 domain-containing protein [Pseudomonadota bacterium]
MQIRHHLLLTGAGALGTALPAAANAQTLNLNVAIPRLSVAEYHRPYVAIWIEKEGATPRTLSIWYDYDMKNGEGTKWLRDVRQWWRASGRSMQFPADGVTGATRTPGDQKIAFTAGRGPLGALTPGNYTLLVEAAREVGGRELLRLPFSWPPKPGATVKVQGASELGAVTLTFSK